MNKEERYNEICKSMTSLPCDKDANSRIILLETRVQDLVWNILEYSDASREQSLALTKLEESLMWVKKAIVLQNNKNVRYATKAEEEALKNEQIK